MLHSWKDGLLVFLQFDMALAKLSKGGKKIWFKCQRKGTIPIGLDGI